MVNVSVGGLHRDQFAILGRKTYLASHSLGAVMHETKQALMQYADDWAELGIEAWDGPFWEAVEDFQALIGGFVGMPPSSICPTGNVTRGMAGIASCFDYRGERRRILISELEFTTTFPFWHGQAELGAEIVVVPSRDGVHVHLEDWLRELDERTLLVVCSHAFFRSGALCPDLQVFVEKIHDFGALLLLDTYQTLGAVPCQAGASGVDIVVGGCHKWLCGGPGAGFLAVHPNVLEKFHPRLTGWMGLANPFEYSKDSGRGVPHPSALRFLGGTPSVPALYAARPALKLITDLGVERIRKISCQLTEGLRERLLEKGFKLRSPSDPTLRNGMLCVEVHNGEQLVRRFSERGCVVDYRPDCGLRVSPHFYNTTDDLKLFIDLLSELHS